MTKVGIKNLKKLVQYVMNNFNGDKQQIDHYLLINAEEIEVKSDAGLNEDDLIDICDTRSHQFTKFVEMLNKSINKLGSITKIKIDYSPPIYFISQSEFGKNIIQNDADQYLQKLNYICYNNYDLNGKFYQKFCTLFFKDLGISSIETRHSGDEGIDIESEIDLNCLDQITKYIIEPKIKMLTQVKFHKVKIDISVIRHLIGDSLFYKFERKDIASRAVQLTAISHLGFTVKAEKFAAKNGVKLFSSDDIINLLMNVENVNNLDCVKYLNEYYQKSRIVS